ncbi:MAG: hypothetical protein ACRDZ3_01390 [Acidimicrobiia bacterium]
MVPTDEELPSLSHAELVEEVIRLREGIRQHRDSTLEDQLPEAPRVSIEYGR